MSQQSRQRTGRKLIVVNFMSLDGRIQSVLSADEDREGGFSLGGWVLPYADDVLAGFMQQKTVDASGMVLGRKTYESFAKVWPHADHSDPSVAAMTRMPKYIASATLTSATWDNTQILGPDIGTEINTLKQQPGKHLAVFGSGGLIESLIKFDLVDEYHLLIFPIMLGTGKRMFPETEDPVRLELTNTVTTTTGVVINSYATSA